MVTLEDVLLSLPATHFIYQPPTISGSTWPVSVFPRQRQKPGWIKTFPVGLLSLTMQTPLAAFKCFYPKVLLFFGEVLDLLFKV